MVRTVEQSCPAWTDGSSMTSLSAHAANVTMGQATPVVGPITGGLLQAHQVVWSL